MDCQWVEDHLEAIFCDNLDEERRAVSLGRISRAAPRAGMKFRRSWRSIP